MYIIGVEGIIMDIKLNSGRSFYEEPSLVDGKLIATIIYCHDNEIVTSDDYNEYASKLAEIETKGSKERQMVDLLASKLTKEEFYELFEIMDGDGPAGQLWQNIAEKAEEFFPDKFNDIVMSALEKEEV